MRNVLRQLLEKKFVRFVIIGGCSTAIDFAIYMLLSIRISIVPAKVISIIIASLFSYVANKNYTFRVRERTNAKYLIKFYIAQALNMGTNVTINTITFQLTQEKLVAFVLATAGGMIVNYLLQKFFVFPEEK